MKLFKYLDHPTDLKVEIYAKNLDNLFINSVLAMMTYLYPKQVDVIEHETKKKINIKADDSKKLLADWLEELLHLSDTNDVCYNDFDLKNISEHEIQVTAFGRRVKAKEDIKKIVEDDLKIEKTEYGFRAVIVFDI